MKKDDFQREVRDRLVDELKDEKGGSSVERMRELSRKALELSDANGDDIPDEDVERLLGEYPEMRREGKGSAEGPESGASGTGGMRR